MTPASAANDSIWPSVERLVDVAPRLSDLRVHRLQYFAAQRWRRLGRPVPDEVREDERVSAMNALATPTVLARARQAYDGPMVLFKGPEVSARYPDPTMRPYRDLDLLAEDAEQAQHALVAAGFRETGDPALYFDIHHLRPLYWPGLPSLIEVHDRPKWPDGLEPPPTRDLLTSAVPSVLGVDGLLTLAPAEHALVLAAHAWAHEPLCHAFQLLDVALMVREANGTDVNALAQKWKMERLWSATLDAVDALFGDGRRPLSLRLWARNIPQARERTVLESHLGDWLAGFWMLPPRLALVQSAARIAQEFRPGPGEPWKRKLARTRAALRNAGVRRSEHEHQLEELALSGPDPLDLLRERARTRQALQGAGADGNPVAKDGGSASP